jgi:outer membrane protein assembly factor BamE
MQKFMLTRITVGILAVSLLGLSQSACTVFGAYKIDIPQGTPLTKEQASQIKIGMTMQQVRYLIGTPTVIDTLNANRWDYLYTYIPGTVARRAGLKAENGQHMIILFDGSGKVMSVVGADTFPTEQPGLPSNQNTKSSASTS